MPHPLKTLLGFGAALACVAPVFAQSATTRPSSPPVEAAPASSDETVVLSPFEVNASKDVGFVANSSLAGGRLAGDLKDTPAAYSVQTREFIDAVGIIDLAEASEWTVNSTSAVTNGNNEIWGSSTQINTRGVSASEPQRNFFELSMNFDSYNVDRFDYARGPNAILFGSGTFGGSSNTVTKVASTGRSFGTLRTQLQSWSGKRVTLDYNQAITSTLAVRANLLWQDNGGWRNFMKDRRRAITLAGLWRPFSNTEIRGEAEVGALQKNNPITTRLDRFLGWDGVTVNPLRVFAAAVNGTGLERVGSSTSPYPVYAPGSGIEGITNWAQTARTLGGGLSGAKFGGLTANGSITLSGNPFTDAVNLPPNIFDLAIANSHFRLPKRTEANSTNEPTVKQWYGAYSAYLRQRVGKNFFAEVAGNIGNERRKTQYMNTRNMSNLYIDVNQLLPNGAPNPHFLDPYSDGQRSLGFLRNQTQNLRAAAAYTLDLKGWGNYIFNTYGGMTWAQSDQKIQTMRVLRNSDPRQWAFNDTIFYRYYTSESDRPLREFDTATYTDPVTGISTKYPVAFINDGTRATDVSKLARDHRYLQAAIKGVYWKKRLHLLAAARNDDLVMKRRLNSNYGDYPTDWNGQTVYFRGKAPADYLTLPLYVPKDANGKPTGSPQVADKRPRDANRIALPQYRSERFQDDYNPSDITSNSTTYSAGGVLHVNRWLSVFGNYATGFAPSSGNLYLDGSLLPSAKSHGSDVGIKLFLLDEKVSISLGRYSSFESPQSAELSGSRNADINNLANANAIDDQSTEGRNKRGFTNVPTQTFDTRDRSNEGYEFELTANPTRNWRVSANYAKPIAYQENAFANTRQFLTDNDAVLRQIASDAGVLIDPTTDFASLDPVINADPLRRSPDANSVVTAWNNLRNYKRTLATGKQKITRLMEYTGNVFTDYRFSEGKLKDITIGAGINFRGKEVIGYGVNDTIIDPANPTKAIDDPTRDEYTPVYAKGYYLMTATLGYRYKLAKRRHLDFQLRVTNLLNEDTVRYYDTITRPPGGDFTSPVRVATPNNYSYLMPRAYSFTTTLSF